MQVRWDRIDLDRDTGHWRRIQMSERSVSEPCRRSSSLHYPEGTRCNWLVHNVSILAQVVHSVSGYENHSTQTPRNLGPVYRPGGSAHTVRRIDQDRWRLQRGAG